MIYDRTLTDVKNAIKIREEKVKKFLPLEENETEILQKGLVTIETISRIEETQSNLKEAMNHMGYYNTNVINKYWENSDFFKDDDLKRIFKNTLVLKDAFFTFHNTPKNIIAKYYFTEFNNLEKILFDISNMTNAVKSFYKECGTFNCGG